MISSVINSGIDYLASQQQQNGGFLSFSSPHPKNFQNALIFQTTFSTALILLCLNNLQSTLKLSRIKKKCAGFLLNQKSDHWSFNYWVKHSKEAQKLPYPDDLDDTFCALAALFHFDPKIIDGKVLAKVVTLLTTLEEQEGGPYRTWLVGKGADQVWKDVDLAVNSNIAYFLSLQQIVLPNLNQFIESKIAGNEITSPYYPKDYSIFYFISRFYQGKSIDKLKNILLSRRNLKYGWDNSLNTALAISTLLNLKINPAEIEKSISFLLNQRRQDYWQVHPFYTGVNPSRDKTYYAGSAALTTAFCLEALSKFLTVSNTLAKKSVGPKLNSAEIIRGQIINQVRERFSSFDQTLQSSLSIILDQVIKIDQHTPIILLPYYFKLSLGKNGQKIKNDLLIKLGMANLYGWMAYTIYDDFLDEEGDPKLLSIANISLRELTVIFNQALPKATGFSAYFTKIMDQLDEANNWEVTHCRLKFGSDINFLENFPIPNFKDYQRLAQKSLGHILGPLALIFSLGFSKDSAEVKNLFKFFGHFLIARQLNDDAHDWEKDLGSGQINPVAALLLKKVNHGNYKLTVLIDKLRQVFWYEVTLDVCQMIFSHVHQARVALKKSQVIVDCSLLDQLLTKHEQSARQALKERQNALKFIKVYQPSAI